MSSLVIDDYVNNSSIPEISYMNALIIKTNAIYRLALEEQSGLGDAKIYYTMAHDIKESYDTWFGLGNIDLHEGKFADALDKYRQAKMLTNNTDEVDEVINHVLFALKKV